MVQQPWCRLTPTRCCGSCRCSATRRPRYQLTARETEVLRLILAHRTNNEIAEALCIAEGTVSDHLKSLFRKTDSKRRTELLTKFLI
jgi:DNA-binding CsgD family transcriptional regulator